MSTPASEGSFYNGILKAYAITISINGVVFRIGEDETRNQLTHQLLEGIWSLVLSKVKPTNSQFVYEVSKKNKLHIHGMFSTYHKFTYKSLQMTGYQIYVRELRTELDERDWYIYTSKDDYMFDGEWLDGLNARTLTPFADIYHGQKETNK